MPCRIAVDFGTSNTVLACWDETLGSARILEIPGWSRPSSGDQVSMPQIPSLIHYGGGEARWIGQQVHDLGLRDSPATVRWMKHYISTRSPVRVPLPGGSRSYREVGADFLGAVLSTLPEAAGDGDIEAVFPVPVESFEHYQDWVITLAGSAGIGRVRVVDEATAAAVASGLALRPGEVFMLFDMGGGTLDVSVVRLEEGESGQGRRCRVLGKAGEDIGGMHMDQWIFEDIRERCGPALGGQAGVSLSRSLLSACERAKEMLSLKNETDISIRPLPGEGVEFSTPYTRDEFERLLEKRGVFPRLNATVQRALQGAYSRGFSEEDLAGVVMVGGCSQVPAVKKALEHRFGREKIRYDHPLVTVARGAAACAAGIDLDDHVQHDYALRFWNSRTGAHEFRTLVRQGDPYPSKRPLARLLIRATYDGQAQMGVPIFEMGKAKGGDRAAQRELVSDPGGGVRLVDLPDEEREKRDAFWMNENAPFFIPAHPPAMRDESRFEISFSLDENKRLLVTARDNRTGHVVMKDRPVVRLV